MKILLVAPFPPPHTGNSLPVKKLYEELQKTHEVDVVNINKNKHKPGVTGVDRIVKVLSILAQVRKKQSNYDLVYLTVAESFAGNVRDMVMYNMCRNRLDSVVIHMLGGAAMKGILTPKDTWQFRQNKKFVSQLGGIIVEGAAQKKTFLNVAADTRIHMIHNFAEDNLYVTKEQVKNNFANTDPLRILFLSNMLRGKGQMEILAAFEMLPEAYQAKLKIDFAGKQVFEDERETFFNGIEANEQLTYHGSVGGETKINLFRNAHVFCLPTHYPFEGQPFTIIEGYASGCFVVTTNHSGIRYIFEDNVNGYEVKKNDIKALSLMFQRLVDDREKLVQIALDNLELAKEEFTMEKYLNAVKNVFDPILEKKNQRKFISTKTKV